MFGVIFLLLLFVAGLVLGSHLLVFLLFLLVQFLPLFAQFLTHTAEVELGMVGLDLLSLVLAEVHEGTEGSLRCVGILLLLAALLAALAGLLFLLG